MRRFLTIGCLLIVSSLAWSNAPHSEFRSPLTDRYASKEMSRIFSPQARYSSWRRLWVALAEAEKDLGLDLTDAQIEEMKQNIDNIDFNAVAKYERQFRHDVMAHVHHFGDQAPSARGIIHLGATSCFVQDNGDLIQMREGLKFLEKKLEKVIAQFSDFAKENATVACLGFTHFQAAQPTTVGKRACLWIQDLYDDLEDLRYRLKNLRFRGVKGTTGTQASFLSLFDGDHEKVRQLDQNVAHAMGFESVYPICGQTYPRTQDCRILEVLTHIATTSHKLATDIRLLCHLKEVEEPFGKTQIGSSAMPYKRNPMRCERICSLARYVMALGENPKYTAATQWLERSLDDSANRRLAIAECFLATDGILNLLGNISNGLVVNKKIIEKHLKEELPFMATENILMACVKKGADRQELHERIRVHSQAAGLAIKTEGADNDLLDRIANDPAFPLTRQEIETLCNVEEFTGRATHQVQEFLATLTLSHEDNLSFDVNV